VPNPQGVAEAKRVRDLKTKFCTYLFGGVSDQQADQHVASIDDYT
jgi:hypothetical protein